MQCDKCGRNAILFQEYSGQHLCMHHFDADVEAKAKHEIRSYQWMIPGDHIAVALSGDHSSAALLYFLRKLTINRRDIRISAISVDEGITGYRVTEHAVRIAESLNIPCIVGSFQESFGISTDEIARIKGPLACTYCRVLRNYLLDRIAGESGVTKLALGVTLDKGAVTVLKDILQGVPERLVGSKRVSWGKIPLIRPFISVPHTEVELYADLHVKSCSQSRCPYIHMPFEEDVQNILNEFSIRHPATKYALMSLKKNLGGACGSIADSRPSCEQCGQPTEGICVDCSIIREVISHGC